MSTRCNIRFIFDKDDFENGMTEFWLYHHFDGYPKGVGADLKAFLKSKNDEMDEDCDNAFARGMGDREDPLNKGEKWTKTKYKMRMYRFPELLDEIVRQGIPGRLGSSDTDGRDRDYRITRGMHGDIEYLYTVSRTKTGHFTVKCEKV